MANVMAVLHASQRGIYENLKAENCELQAKNAMHVEAENFQKWAIHWAGVDILGNHYLSCYPCWTQPIIYEQAKTKKKKEKYNHKRTDRVYYAPY